jgi:DNA-binding NarL/FixJ family response regulator
LTLAAAHGPDVIITDAGIFECCADQAEQMLLRESPQSRVLFLTTREDADADGVRRVTRQTGAHELVEILRRKCSSERVVVREMPRRGREDWPAEKLRPKKRGLHTREREVLELLAAG